MYSSDSLGTPKDSFERNEPVYATIWAPSFHVTLNVVPDKTSWENGDPVVDCTSEGCKTLTFEQGATTQIIEILPNSLENGKYDLVLDIGNDGIFNSELDLADSGLVAGFEIVDSSINWLIIIAVIVIIIVVGIVLLILFRKR